MAISQAQGAFAPDLSRAGRNPTRLHVLRFCAFQPEEDRPVAPMAHTGRPQ